MNSEHYDILRDSYGRYYLSHGIEWKNHKYIKKIGQGKSALYFYTMKELQSYLHNVQERMKKTGETAATAGAKVAQTLEQKGGTALASAKASGERVYGIAKNAATNSVSIVKAKAPPASSTAKSSALSAKASQPVSTRSAQPEAKANAEKSLQNIADYVKTKAEKAKQFISNVSNFDAAAAAKRVQHYAEKTIGQFRDAAGSFIQQVRPGKSQNSSSESLSASASESTSADVPQDTPEASGSELGKRPTAHQKNVSGTAKEGWSKRRDLNGSENGPNPAHDLQEAANALIDPDILVPSDASPDVQFIEYSKAVDAKYQELYQTNRAEATKYMREQLFVLGAMASAQYYTDKKSYESAYKQLDQFKQEATKAQRDYDKALSEYNSKKKSMSREEKKTAEENLRWKKDSLAVSNQNVKNQETIVASYLQDMEAYQKVVQECTTTISMIKR